MKNCVKNWRPEEATKKRLETRGKCDKIYVGKENFYK